jgi:predicted nucleotidyltransferase/DNA-binding XRE family transcriptional regulator
MRTEVTQAATVGMQMGQKYRKSPESLLIDNQYYYRRMGNREDNATGKLLRQARLGAQLSQTEVARRAHVAQSVISAYESGRREPSVSTLERLIRATGHRLVLDLERSSDCPPGLPDTPLGRQLRHHRRAILACAELHGAKNVRVFGSTARGEDRPNSDVDFVIDLAKGTGLFNLEALRRELSQILGVPVDVAPSDSLRPRVREEVEREAIPL